MILSFFFGQLAEDQPLCVLHALIRSADHSMAFIVSRILQKALKTGKAQRQWNTIALVICTICRALKHVAPHTHI